jgi:hypothetical protein
MVARADAGYTPDLDILKSRIFLLEGLDTILVNRSDLARRAGTVHYNYA